MNIDKKKNSIKTGKTSLIRTLTGEQQMQPMNQLFATLDVTVHAGLLSNKMKVLYVDTVGFISDIPTDLVQCFTSTLQDMIDAVSLLFSVIVFGHITFYVLVNVHTAMSSVNISSRFPKNSDASQI